MAKKAAAEKPNKAALVRAYKQEHANAQPKEIADAISKTGVNVTAQYVSMTLSAAKKKEGGAHTGGKKSNGLSRDEALLLIYRAAARETKGSLAELVVELKSIKTNPLQNLIAQVGLDKAIGYIETEIAQGEMKEAEAAAASAAKPSKKKAS